MSSRLRMLMGAVATLVFAGVALGMVLARRGSELPAVPAAAPSEKKSWLIGLSLHFTKDDYGIYLNKTFMDTLDAAHIPYFITDAEHSGEKQREDIERQIARRVDALVIVPTDDQMITQETNKAADLGIPIIAVTAIPGTRVTTTILGRDRENGFDAGTILARKLGGKGKVLVLTTLTTPTRVRLRHEGFEAALRGTNIEIIGTKRTISAEEGMAAVDEALRQHPDLNGIFAAFSTALVGAASEVRALNRKDIIITGIDADYEVLKLLQEGWVEATLAQYPSEHGRLAAESALRILRGEPPIPSVDTPFKVVTRENAAAMAQELWGRELR